MAVKKPLVGDPETGIHGVWVPGSDTLEHPDGGVLGGGGGMGWITEGAHDDFLDPPRHASQDLGLWTENYHALDNVRYEILEAPNAGLRIQSQAYAEKAGIYVDDYSECSRSGGNIWTHLKPLYDVEVTLEPKLSRLTGDWWSYVAHVFYDYSQGLTAPFRKNRRGNSSFSGTVTSNGTPNIVGVGTLFTQEVVPGDMIAIEEPVTFRLRNARRVRRVIDDLNLELSDGYPTMLSGQAMRLAQDIDLYALQMRLYTLNTDPPVIEKIEFDALQKVSDSYDGDHGDYMKRYYGGGAYFGSYPIPGSRTSIRLRVKVFRQFMKSGGAAKRYVTRYAFGYHDDIQWRHLHSFYGMGLEFDPLQETWLSRIPKVVPGHRDLPAFEIGMEREAQIQSEIYIRDFKDASDQEWAELDALPLPLV